MAQLFIGTSGWSYDGWIGDFYPENIEKRDMLSFYAKQFNTVEINATYYRLPFKNMIKGWYNRAPNGFLYAVKGHRRVTHYNKLKDVEEPVANHIERVKELGDHLGPLLWQLPPGLHMDAVLLDDFLEGLPHEYRHAVEFRHKSWLNPEVFKVMRKHNAAQVWISSHQMPADFTDTADFVYARFHGLEGGYRYDYNREELKPWAEEMKKAKDLGKDVFAYFNNDVDCNAPYNAKLLRDILSE
ncbi:MAG TPA: DUF72 domain-containing protein [Balneolales bacterium]|nr:DUF72 domain-containing protein [Balneolales bacterium]